MKSVMGDKADVRAAFVKLLVARYPVTMQWHGLGQPVAPALPEWTRPAFEKERRNWRDLSRLTVNHPDPEVQHWGRFARVCLTRIEQGSWRAPSAPLREAMAAIMLGSMTEGPTQREWLGHLLEYLPQWLKSVEPSRGAGEWERMQWRSYRVQFEQLVRTCVDDQHLAIETSAFAPALDGLERSLQVEPLENRAVSWFSSGHVNSWEWHSRRLQYLKPVLSSVRWERDGDLSTQNLAHRTAPWALPDEPVQFREVEALGTNSVARNAGGPVIYYGPQAYGSVILSGLLLQWQRYAQCEPLSWVLTPPPLIESGMQMLAAAALFPEQGAVAAWFENWRNWQDALALADAWMWLEGEDPGVVRNWLATIISPQDADRWILLLMTDPGRKAGVDSLAREQQQHAENMGMAWPAWKEGPVHWVLT